MNSCSLKLIGEHDSSFFLFLVKIDYDAKPVEFFTQELWGELQRSIFSTPLIEILTDSLDTRHTEDEAFNPKPIDPELDDSEQLTGESIQLYLSLVGQLQWLGTWETCHPRTSHYLVQVQVNSMEATNNRWLCQQDHSLPLDSVQILSL